MSPRCLFISVSHSFSESLSAIFFFLFLFSSSISFFLFFPCIPSSVLPSPFLLYLILPFSFSNPFFPFFTRCSFFPFLPFFFPLFSPFLFLHFSLSVFHLFFHLPLSLYRQLLQCTIPLFNVFDTFFSLCSSLPHKSV